MSSATNTIGPTITMDMPQRMVMVRTRARSSGGVDATSVAPVVENGETSTIEAHTAIALIRAQSLTPPEVARGTANGTSAARMPVV